MAQMRKLDITAELQLEGKRPETIVSRLLSHLDHNLRGFRLRVDELASNREVIIAFRQTIRGWSRGLLLLKFALPLS